MTSWISLLSCYDSNEIMFKQCGVGDGGFLGSTFLGWLGYVGMQTGLNVLIVLDVAKIPPVTNVV